MPEGYLSAWAQYTVRLTGLASSRDAIQAQMKEHGIPTAVYYGKPLHVQGAYDELRYSPEDFPHSMTASAEVLSLPFSPDLAATDVERVSAEHRRRVIAVNRAA